MYTVRLPRPAAAAIVSMLVLRKPTVANSPAATSIIISRVLFLAIAQNKKYVQS
jgi:hypothetical protein